MANLGKPLGIILEISQSNLSFVVFTPPFLFIFGSIAFWSGPLRKQITEAMLAL